LPDNLVGRTYYQPVERGFEREIRSRLAYWRKVLGRRNDGNDEDGS
jgi:putative ATPase